MLAVIRYINSSHLGPHSAQHGAEGEFANFLLSSFCGCTLVVYRRRERVSGQYGSLNLRRFVQLSYPIRSFI